VYKSGVRLKHRESRGTTQKRDAGIGSSRLNHVLHTAHGLRRLVVESHSVLHFVGLSAAKASPEMVGNLRPLNKRLTLHSRGRVLDTI
jgi:hypothetical protein